MLTFYDIPSTIPGIAWSPNTWKTRYSLNFKGIPYKTEWVEYPDIKALYQKIGAKPTTTKADGSPYYSLPLIHDDSIGAVVSESALIAQYLDNAYPDTPKLFPPGTAPLQHAFIDVHTRMISALMPFAIPKSNSILNRRSEEYFRRTREAIFGMKLEDLVPKGEERERQWAKVQADFARIDSWYQKGKDDGPYLLGNNICFADLQYAAHALWMKKIWGEQSAEWSDVKTWNEGRLVALLDSHRISINEMSRSS